MEYPRNHQRKRQRVLVFPCGSEVGLEIHRALSYSTHVELLGASSLSSNHGKYVFRQYHEGLPYVGDPQFIPAIARLAAEREADFLFPAHDSAVLALAQAQESLPCPVVTSPRETCQICRSKGATYARFHGVVPVPAIFSPDNPDIAYPVFLKPDVGESSRGVVRAASLQEVEFYRRLDPTRLILEYLPGPEYTVDCFTDRHGVLRFAGARERLRVQNGISVDTQPVDAAEFQPLANRINETLAFRGAWFFQLKRRDSGELVLMEIAPRISGGMGLYRNLGVNFPLLSIFDRMDCDVELSPLSHTLRMDRALISRFHLEVDYQRAYIDLDDTLIVDGEVHPLALMFLAQCRTRKIPVHVLTRHAGNAGETMLRHGLNSLVDRIVHVGENACKSDYMPPGPAIFIDDSFAERKRVRDRLGIPVFAVDAIECLLDWRV